MENTEQKSISTENGSFSTGQSWGALRKAWKGYRIAKVKGEMDKQKEYATKIRSIQNQLNLTPATFPHLGIE